MICEARPARPRSSPPGCSNQTLLEQSGRQIEMPLAGNHPPRELLCRKLPKGPLYDYSVTIADVTPKTADDSGKGGKGMGKEKVKRGLSHHFKSSGMSCHHRDLHLLIELFSGYDRPPRPGFDNCFHYRMERYVLVCWMGHSLTFSTQVRS